MKVLHIDSGLGNQMLGYCEYLAMKKMNPDEDCYIETLIYEIPECNEKICQWNGYELDRIFGFHTPNIKEIITKEQYESVKKQIVASDFWDKNWNFSPYVVAALNHYGLKLENRCRLNSEIMLPKTKLYKRIAKAFGGANLKYYLQRYDQQRHEKEYVAKFDDHLNLFVTSSKNIYAGQRFSFIYKQNDIEKIDAEIRVAFRFPKIIDYKSLEALKLINNSNSVALHARRGDMIGRTGVYYKCGYFKRAVRYMKQNIESPEFFFFCDPGSVSWCRENLKLFALDLNKDKIHFVDWNNGNESYRDMQLMSICKHNIVTTSSFGWWGAYLNKNPDKITCSPDVSYNTTHHF